MFLRKNDSKVTALMQQAKFLSLLTHEVNTENTSQSIENAWKVRKINQFKRVSSMTQRGHEVLRVKVFSIIV